MSTLGFIYLFFILLLVAIQIDILDDWYSKFWLINLTSNDDKWFPIPSY